MSLDENDRLGSLIGGMDRRQDDLAQNISPNEPDAQTQIIDTANVLLQGTVVITRKSYPTDSFILDHPVYGELNSPTLKLNGGYATTVGGSFTFPATFPLTFSGGASATEVLFTKTF